MKIIPEIQSVEVNLRRVAEPRRGSPMRIHTTTLGTEITRATEFERKGLATHAVNVGTKCGHSCFYCSTGAILRMHHSFMVSGEHLILRYLTDCREAGEAGDRGLDTAR